jgi:hypothetical protein
MLACLLLSFYLLQHQSLLLYQRSDDYHSTLLTICFFHFLSPLRCHVNRRSFFHSNIPLTSNPTPSTVNPSWCCCIDDQIIQLY